MPEKILHISMSKLEINEHQKEKRPSANTTENNFEITICNIKYTKNQRQKTIKN